MSAIFKTRKTPRHLVIDREPTPIRRPRARLPLLLACSFILLLVAAAVMQFLPGQ